MSDTTYAYPFDPTGTAQTNQITSESQAISPPGWSDFYFIIPQAAPFFRESMVIYHHPSGQRLHEGVDYLPTHRFHDASLATGKPVYGSITFYDKTLTGVVEMTYQTVGGAWTLDAETIIDILSNKTQNPRITTWEQVVELPDRFPVIDHEWDLDDMVGMSEVVEALTGIEQAIRDSDDSNFSAHLNDFANPHQVSKAQVGLGNVQNYAIATVPQATDGTSNAVYMTPLRTAQAITTQAVNPLNNHISNQNNPHGVTKAQVGLGLVQNYGVATEAEAIDGSSSTTYMSALRVRQAINAVALAALTTHTTNQSNPHNVTKAQVGLGSVEDFPLASVEEARSGVANNLYMTPMLVREAILSSAVGDITSHVNNLNNPHQVSKAQVGLANVQNYPVATETIALEGESNAHYMTALRVREVLNLELNNTILPHLNDTDNPHLVTKAQVGLGNVDNYPTATPDDVLQGTSNSMFVTPAGVKSLVDTLDAGGVQEHIADTDNPHQVTKDQVGLSNVENYGLASQAEAESGISNVLYMTPLRTRQAMDVHPVIAAFEDHANDTNNPHGVTKDQIGLGSVENYGPLAAGDLDGVGGLGELPFDRVLTPQTFQALTNLATSDLRQEINDHIDRTDNPHMVTAGQVGAYTVAETDALVTGAVAEKLDADATATNSERLEGFTFAELRAQLQNVYRYPAVRPYTVIIPADPEDPDSEDEETIVNNGPTWTRLAYFDLTFKEAGPGNTAVFEAIDPIMFTLAGGESTFSGEADVYEVSVVPHEPSRSDYRRLTGEGSGVVLLQRTMRAAIDFGEGEPNDPDPDHPSNFVYWYELWSQDPIQRNMIEINTTRFPITSSFFTPTSTAEDAMPAGLSAIQRLADLSAGGGDSLGSVDFDIANVADDSDRVIGDYSGAEVDFNEQVSLFENQALGLDGNLIETPVGTMAQKTWHPTATANTAGLTCANLSNKNDNVKYLSISDRAMRDYAFEMKISNSAIGVSDPEPGVALGVCIAHVMNGGKSHGLYAYRTDGGIEGAGLFVVGYNLFQPDQVILESSFETLKWGDGLVDADREQSDYTAPVDAAGNIIQTGNSSQMGMRVIKRDGMLTIECTEFGSESNYATGPSATIDLSDYPQLQALFEGETNWGLAAFNTGHVQAERVDSPGRYRAYYAKGTLDGTQTATLLSDSMTNEVRRFEYSGIADVPHITHCAPHLKLPYYEDGPDQVTNLNAKRVNWKNRLIYSPISGKLYLGRADGGLRHLLIDADSVNGETVLTP